MRFEDLGINEPIIKALREKGYENPTPIQIKAIPEVLNKKDILGSAQTGTGKTAAFAVPIIQMIYQREGNKSGKPALRSLIVTPTRELAIQIDENIKFYNKHTRLQHAVIFGGVKQGKQVEKLKRGVHILVATPGRLLDLIGQGFIHLNDIKIFVLDEADRMLDMGFIHDINKILKMLPRERQSLFFSATMPQNIVALSRTILDAPVKIEVARVSSAADTVKQLVYYTNRGTKRDLLLKILQEKSGSQALVFTRTKHGADRLCRYLSKAKINASAIHGDKAQNQRQKALQMFKDRKLRVLVATDIAARGIDIDKLDLVVNYEIPNEPETYVHRIGRTGRAGETGLAISLSEPEENSFVRAIQKLISKKLEVVENHSFPQTDKEMTEAEKKEWNKQKQKRKMEMIQARRESTNKRSSRNSSSNNNSKSSNRKNQDGRRGDAESKNQRPEAKKQNKNTKPRKEADTTSKSKHPQSNTKNSSDRRDQDQQAKNKSQESGGKKRKGDDYKGKKGRRTKTKLPPSLASKYMWPLD